MFQRNPLASFFLVLFSLPLFGGETFPLKVEKFLTSPILPVIGGKIEFRINLFNEADEPLRDVKLFLLVGKGKQKSQLKEVKIEQMGAKERRKVEMGEWTAQKNGIYEAELQIDTGKEKKEVIFSFPVVERKVEFAWYGTPKDLRWATISTTIEKDYIEEWLWEGRIPLAFKPGVCFWDKHKEAPIQAQISCWSDIPKGAEGIGIDEYGEGEAGNKVKEAIKGFKEKYPDYKIALWTVGGIPEDLAPYVDYFLPECYLNYHNMHLGILMNCIEHIKSKGLERKTLLGLGINYEPNQGVLLTTPEELEAQFKLAKSLRPDLLGIAIFYYGSVPQLDKLSDELFYRYFVLPVYAYQWEIKEDKGKPLVVGWVKNIGNMDGGQAEVQLLVDGKKAKRTMIKSLKVESGEKFVFTLDDLTGGFRTLRVKIGAHPDVTVLDNEKEEVIGIRVPFLKQGKGLALWLPACLYPRTNQPLRFPLPKGWAYARVYTCDSRGEIIKELPAQRNDEGELVWVEKYIPEGEKRFYLLCPEDKTSHYQSPLEEELDFSNDFYRIVIGSSTDEIKRLQVKGEDIISSPWRLEINPSYNLSSGKAKIVKGEVFLEVIIPFQGNGLKGESHYLLYHHSPLIEIRRKLIPEINLKLDSAREGTRFAQREGFFQVFPGEGALRISKGRLEVSEQYRDIYFGYLGGSPAPENFEKAGWFNFRWDKPPVGLGVGIIKRWIDCKSRTYDVTRFYDGGDWIDIFYVFQTTAIFTRPQESFVILLPHESCDLEKGIAPILPFYWTERNGLKTIPIFPDSVSNI